MAFVYLGKIDGDCFFTVNLKSICFILSFINLFFDREIKASICESKLCEPEPGIVVVTPQRGTSEEYERKARPTKEGRPKKIHVYSLLIN